MHPTVEAAVNAVQALFDHSAEILGPQMDARPEAAFRDPEVRNVQVTQNVMRLCLEAVFQRLHPFTVATPVELAVRLASYAISALPIEEQELALDNVVGTLPEAHAQRIRQGIALETTWVVDGEERANRPRSS